MIFVVACVTHFEMTIGCVSGYTGERCDVDIDECQSNPCLNGGVCTQGIGNYTCSCVGEILNLTVHTRDPRTVYR